MQLLVNSSFYDSQELTHTHTYSRLKWTRTLADFQLSAFETVQSSSQLSNVQANDCLVLRRCYLQLTAIRDGELRRVFISRTNGVGAVVWLKHGPDSGNLSCSIARMVLSKKLSLRERESITYRGRKKHATETRQTVGCWLGFDGFLYSAHVLVVYRFTVQGISLPRSNVLHIDVLKSFVLFFSRHSLAVSW